MVWQIGFGPPVRHPDVEFLDGDFREIAVAEPDPDSVMARQVGPSAFVFGRPLAPNAIASKAVWRPAEPTYDYMTLHRASLISERMRHLIEVLEPDVHQYFPVEFVDPQARHLASQWIWIPCNRIDGVDRGRTTMVLHHGRLWRAAREVPEEERPPGADLSLDPKLVFSELQCAGFSFWRDKHMTGQLFCADDAAEAIEAEGLVGVRLSKRESV